MVEICLGVCVVTQICFELDFHLGCYNWRVDWGKRRSLSKNGLWSKTDLEFQGGPRTYYVWLVKRYYLCIHWNPSMCHPKLRVCKTKIILWRVVSCDEHTQVCMKNSKMGAQVQLQYFADSLCIFEYMYVVFYYIIVLDLCMQYSNRGSYHPSMCETPK